VFTGADGRLNEECNMNGHLIAGIMALTVALPAAAAGQVDLAAERTAIEQVLTSYAENVQSGSFGAIEGMLTQGAHVVVGTQALHGLSEYREASLQADLARYPGVRYTHTGVETSLRGNVAWAAFRWQMSGGTSAPAPTLGRGTAVLEKVGGRWMIAHLHFSR
jgi:ketosteroid isomerase-like protein